MSLKYACLILSSFFLLEERSLAQEVRWTDPYIVSGATPVRAVHVQQLRDYINAKLDACGLPQKQWSDNPLIAGVTPIRVRHFMELKQALVELKAGLAGLEPHAGQPIRTMDIMALRNAALQVSCEEKVDLGNVGAADLCIDHWIESAMIHNPSTGKLELWIWGTNPFHQDVGWNCQRVRTEPILLWSSAKSYTTRPSVYMVVDTKSGKGCDSGHTETGNPYQVNSIGVCPASGRGNATFDIQMQISPSKQASGPTASVPTPFMPTIQPPPAPTPGSGGGNTRGGGANR